MRLHIDLDDELVSKIDRAVGPGGRTQFIREAIDAALLRDTQREFLASARSSIRSEGHPWDSNPAAWVRAQRKADRRKGH
jgi:Arc/MetJ family transcription regulator